MSEHAQHLLNQYWDWLKENTKVQPVNDWIEITTPYLDRHNDCLQIYARASGAGYVFTDDGYILDDLAHGGIDISSGRRRALLEETLNGFGVREVAGTLQAEASDKAIGLCKHNLIQAMLAVSDMFYLASPMVASVFHEDVTCWLDSSKIRYTRDVKLRGKSGYDHKFDFVVPKSPGQPERVCRSINRSDRSAAQSMAFAWLDTQKNRAPGSTAYAFINDSDKPVAQSVDQALRNYGVEPVPWSQRESVVEGLLA